MEQFGKGPRRAYRTGCGVHALFEATADRRPEAVAVEDGDGALTYGDLDRFGNRLAHRLAAAGVEKGQPVGICLERSALVAVTILGVLKAGAVCVPLDPDYPSGRLEAMAEDGGISVICVTAGTSSRLQGDYVFVTLDNWRDELKSGDSARPATAVGDSDIAYLISTSGSTGKPKSVMVRHGGLVNHAQAAAELYELTSTDRIIQVSSISFDISIEEMFPLWHAGGTVIFRPANAPLSGRGFLDDLVRYRVSMLDLPTALWSQWTRDLERFGESPPAHLRAVVVGGERAQSAVLAAWRRVDSGTVRWFNTYGPTEASVIATSWEAPRRWDASMGEVPLGEAVPNVDLYIVDADMRPVGAGDEGELLIGGAGVAAGYLGRPELTAERFLANVYGGTGLVYRTGDLARWGPDGQLQFIGRNDDQVKIRGFRVEPGEIAASLARHPDVAEAVVTSPVGADGQRRLVAYTVARSGKTVDEGAVWQYLARRLPAYMVPTAFVGLKEFPLTPNGKVDKAALPEPPRPKRLLPTSPTPPRTPMEEQLAAIWRDILDLDEVGVEDDFFAVGGFSIAAVWMLGEVESRMGLQVPLPSFLEDPTVAGLAHVAEEGATSGRRTCLQPVSGRGSRPPLVHICTAEPGVMALRHFVAAFGREQPVFALVLKRLDGFDRPETTVEQLADIALPELVKTVGEGPYLLTGYSVGGLLAFELANRLVAEGREVRLVGLLDTWSPVPVDRNAKVRYWAARMVSGEGDGWTGRRQAVKEILRAVSYRLPDVSKMTRGAGGAQSPGSVPAEDRMALDDPDDADHVGDMYFRYRPPRLDCPVVLFRTNRTARSFSDWNLGWTPAQAPRMRTVTIPGMHGTVMREPNVHDLAARLAQEIRR